jgi:hypothetical protein
MLRHWASVFIVVPVFVGTFLGGTRAAQAQLHWDASLQGGAAKRFLTSAAAQPGIGPTLQLGGHVAFVPLVRLGGYLSYDSSPITDAPARHVYSAGLRAKVQAPWAFGNAEAPGHVHAWAFLGGGFALVYGPSTYAKVTVPPIDALSPPTTETLAAPGATGHYFEVPAGIGVGIRLRKPWELVFELAGRVGFGFAGELYDGRPAVSSVTGTQVLGPLGNDTFALLLTGGIGLDL